MQLAMAHTFSTAASAAVATQQMRLAMTGREVRDAWAACDAEAAPCGAERGA
jgi:hypothetical protein